MLLATWSVRLQFSFWPQKTLLTFKTGKHKHSTVLYYIALHFVVLLPGQHEILLTLANSKNNSSSPSIFINSWKIISIYFSLCVFWFTQISCCPWKAAVVQKYNWLGACTKAQLFAGYLNTLTSMWNTITAKLHSPAIISHYRFSASYFLFATFSFRKASALILPSFFAPSLS